MDRIPRDANEESTGVAGAIRQVVDEALEHQLVIHSAAEAQRIAAEFPASGMTVSEIATALLQIAIEHGAPVRIANP